MFSGSRLSDSGEPAPTCLEKSESLKTNGKDENSSWKTKDIRQLFTWTRETGSGNSQKIVFWKMQRRKSSFDQTVIESEDEVKVVELKKSTEFGFL